MANSTTWWLVGGIVVGIGGAIYLGSHLSPSAGTVVAVTPNTNTIDTNNSISQGELSALSAQGQIMSSLGLTPLQTNTATAGTLPSGGAS